MFANLKNSFKSLMSTKEPTINLHTKYGDVDIDPSKVKTVGEIVVEFKCYRPGSQLTKTCRRVDQIDTNIYKKYVGVAYAIVTFKNDTKTKLVWQFDNEPHPERFMDDNIDILRERVVEIRNRSIYETLWRKFWKVACLVSSILVTVFLIILKGRLDVARSKRF